MKIHEVQQGTPAWHALRAGYFTASEASAMMGVSKYMTRQELLRNKATGFISDVSPSTQKLFDRGHATEESARAIAEQMIGEDLYPATVTDDAEYLLASLDGMTMDGGIIFEHKLLNADLVADLGKGIMPECHKWQVIQALVITGAERCLFAVSDGTEENFHHIWVTLGEDDASRLIAGWKQFEQDLNDYQHVEVAPKLEGRAPEQLPALRIEVTGMVTASNIDAFRDQAIAVFRSINRDLLTDEDFADAEKTIKWCKGVEDRLKAAKQHALSQTADIDALFRAIDEIEAEARTVRLDLTNTAEKRKKDIRAEIMQENQLALNAHIQTINARLTPVYLPEIKADFAAAMKGKKTVQTLRDAADAELARAKIAANQLSEAIGANLRIFDELAADHRFLFRDLQQLALKPGDDFALAVKARIADHKAAEAAKLEAERERIRQEEEAKARREEAEAKVRAEQESTAKAERADEQRGQQAQMAQADQAKEVASEQSNPNPIAEIDDARTNAPIARHMPKKRERPTDAEIIIALCLAFNEPQSTVIGWLADMNMENVA